jgi:hypothetical protein
VAAGANPISPSTKKEPKKEAAITAWMNSSISLLGSQLIKNVSAQKK